MRRADSMLAIDFGGTKIAVAVCATDGTIRDQRVVPCPSDAQSSLTSASTLGRELLGGADPVAVGVSFGGPIRRGSTHMQSRHVPGWESIDLASAIGTTFSAPVSIDNDANAGCLSEWQAWGRTEGTLVYLTVSTGVGGAICEDGVMAIGRTGLAGEIGHIDVPGQPRAECTCGRLGHLEAVASGLSIAKRYRDLTMTYGSDLDQDVTGEDVDRAAAEGDWLAAAVLADAGRAIGWTLAQLAKILDPDAVVIGGGVSQAGPILWDTIGVELERACWPVDPPEVRRPVYGSMSALHGAISLARTVL